VDLRQRQQQIGPFHLAQIVADEDAMAGIVNDLPAARAAVARQSGRRRFAHRQPAGAPRLGARGLLACHPPRRRRDARPPALAAARPDRVTMPTFAVARHTKLWNCDQAGWTAAITDWMIAR